MLTHNPLAQEFTYRHENEALDKILTEFKNNLKFWRDEEEQRQKLAVLKNYLSAILFGRQSDGAFLRATPEYSYTDFSIIAAGKNLRTPKRDNLLSLLKEFAGRTLKNNRGMFDGDGLAVIKNIDKRMQEADIPVSKSVRRADPDSKNADPVYLAPLPYHLDKEGHAVHTRLNKPAIYKSSFWSSLGTSFLLGGASRIAIMAAGGTVGIGALPLALLAGVGTGAIMSYYKNREAIAKEVALEETFAGRMGARWRGFRQSYTTKQFLTNTVFSALGFTVAAPLFEAVVDNVSVAIDFPGLKQTFMEAAAPQIEWMAHQTANLGNALEDGYYAAVDTAEWAQDTLSDQLQDVDLSGISVATAAVYEKAGDGLEWTRDLVEDLGLKNPDPALPEVEVASNEIVSDETTATVADVKSSPVIAPAETIQMVEHTNMPAVISGQPALSDAEFEARFGELSVSARSINVDVVDSTKLINAMESREVISTATERAQTAFNAVTNPVIPVTETVDKVDVFVLPSDDARISEVLRQTYHIDPDSIEGKAVLSKVQAYNGYADGFEVNPGDEIKIPFDLLGRPDESVTHSAALVSDKVIATSTDSVPGYVDPRVSVVKPDEVVASLDPAPVTADMETHTVKRGDSLWKLTRTEYGLTNSAERWEAIEKIVAANAADHPELLKDPTALTRGWDLKMPDLDDPNTPSADCKIVRGRARGCTLG